MQLHLEEKTTAHAKAMADIQETFPEQNNDLKTKFIDVFNQGLENPEMYNRAIRRLCTYSDRRVAPLLTKLLKYQLVLKISVSETNNQGKSALDYAQTNNLEAYKVLEASLRSAIAAPVQKMLSGKPSAHTPTTAEQDKMLDDAADEMFKGISNVVLTEENTMAYARSGPQERFDLCQNIAMQFIEGMQPSINKMRETMPAINLSAQTSQNNFVDAVREVTKRSSEYEELIDLYNQDNIEACLRWMAQKIHPQILAIFELFTKFTPTTFDINQMLNSDGQTPLHGAAISANWGIYYALIGTYRANSLLPDNSGRSAASYRRDNFASTGETSGFAGVAQELLTGILNPTQASDSATANAEIPECRPS